MALFFYKEKNKDIRAAAYLRLSIVDGDKAESNSIGNQRELIRDFAAERPGLHLVEEYADDGYTGTNFERPGFKRMMEDIKSGKINCIIVKDLSRLGRNYIEMGKYLEQIFPMMGIRFIAITDTYDNANSESSDEIKSHHYIISFDPRDSTENCLTGKRAQELGLEYAKANFPGHQALVCTHMDGHNGSGNIHVHIVINSLRKLDVPPQPFMERPIDCKAGYKHHVTNEYLKHLQKSLMDLCNREFLHQVDLLSPSRTGVTEAEYWAQRRLDEKKREIEKEGSCSEK